MSVDAINNSEVKKDAEQQNKINNQQVTNKQSYYLTLSNAQYLYQDEYGKHVFLVDKGSEHIAALYDRIKKFNTVNPIVVLKDQNYKVKFNDVKHLWKSRVYYDVIYFIHRHDNANTKKVYINLHITDMQQRGKKDLTKVKISDLI